MMEFSNAEPGAARRPYFSLRDLSQIAAAGVGAALVDIIVKRSLGMVLPAVPFSGSLVAALPRTLLILVVACRTEKAGAIALLCLVEGAMNFAMGGVFPLSFVSPVGAGLAGEATWLLMGTMKRFPLVRLAGTGAVLAVGRLVMASGFAVLLGLPLVRWFTAAPHMVAAIFLVNLVLGGLAGVLSRVVFNELQSLGLAANEKRRPN